MNSTTILATMNIDERLAYAGRMTLIGMLTIFAALSILWLALVLFRRAIEAKQETGEKPAAPAPKISAPAPAPAPKASNDGELVVAITAAVSIMLAEENGGRVPNFRVVSFRRSRGNH